MSAGLGQWIIQQRININIKDGTANEQAAAEGVRVDPEEQPVDEGAAAQQRPHAVARQLHGREGHALRGRVLHAPAALQQRIPHRVARSHLHRPHPRPRTHLLQRLHLPLHPLRRVVARPHRHLSLPLRPLHAQQRPQEDQTAQRRRVRQARSRTRTQGLPVELPRRQGLIMRAIITRGQKGGIKGNPLVNGNQIVSSWSYGHLLARTDPPDQQVEVLRVLHAADYQRVSQFLLFPVTLQTAAVYLRNGVTRRLLLLECLQLYCIRWHFT